MGRQVTPASSKWLQLCVPMGLARQSISLVSVPEQATLSSWIGPLPWPKNAWVRAFAPNEEIKNVNLKIKICYINSIFTSRTESQLPTHDIGISTTPCIVTHCPPYTIIADLNAAFKIRGTANQTKTAISTRCWKEKEKRKAALESHDIQHTYRPIIRAYSCKYLHISIQHLQHVHNCGYQFHYLGSQLVLSLFLCKQCYQEGYLLFLARRKQFWKQWHLLQYREDDNETCQW